MADVGADGPRLVDLAPRILYLAGHFMAPPYTAGSSRPLELARRLAADGHQVTLLSTDAFLRQAGLTLADIPADHLGGVEVVLTRSGYANDMGFTRRKVEFAAQATKQAMLALLGEVDLVYATSTPLTVLGPALARSWLRGTPFAFEVRDVWPQAAIEMGALDEPWQQRAAHWLADTGYANAIQVITLSEGMRDLVVARGVDPTRVTVAHNAAAPAAVAAVAPDGALDDRGREAAPHDGARADATSTASARAIIDFLAGARFAGLYAGTLGRANDVTWLVDLIAAVDAAVDLRVAIVGTGSEVDRIRAAIAATPPAVRARIALFDMHAQGFAVRGHGPRRRGVLDLRRSPQPDHQQPEQGLRRLGHGGPGGDEQRRLAGPGTRPARCRHRVAP